MTKQSTCWLLAKVGPTQINDTPTYKYTVPLVNCMSAARADVPLLVVKQQNKNTLSALTDTATSTCQLLSWLATAVLEML
jgi:hypothetical protein